MYPGHRVDYKGLIDDPEIRRGYSPQHLSDYDEDDREQYYYDLERRQDEIRSKFCSLLFTVFQFLEKHAKLKELILFFKSQFHDDDTIMTKLSDVSSFEALYTVAMRFFCSYFNYEVIETLVKQYGNKKIKNALYQYQEDFRHFVITVYNNRVVYCGNDIGKNKTVFKLDYDAKRTITSFEIRQVKERISGILSIKSSQLYLHRIREGCLELEFCLSVSVCKHILELKSESRRELFRAGITFIGVAYSSHQREVCMHVQFCKC